MILIQAEELIDLLGRPLRVGDRVRIISRSLGLYDRTGQIISPTAGTGWFAVKLDDGRGIGFHVSEMERI